MLDKIDVITAAVRLLQDDGYEAELCADYSGRGMYGDTTAGIVTDTDIGRVNQYVRLATLECLEQKDDQTEHVSHRDMLVKCSKYELRRSDNMGRDYIYY